MESYGAPIDGRKSMAFTGVSLVKHALLGFAYSMFLGFEMETRWTYLGLSPLPVTVANEGL